MKNAHRSIALFAALAGLLLMASAQQPSPPAALNRPALMSAKAQNAALLAIARAGDRTGGRLVASGERGIVLYSDDQGRTWQQAVTPTNASLVSLRFVDDKRGWAVGHMGVVLHTGDGGKTWTKQLDGIQAAQIALEAAQKSGDQKRIGQAQALVDDGPDKPFFDLCFVDAKTAYIVGAYNLAFRTDDGGKTWQDWSGHVDNPKGFHLYAMTKAADALYIVGEQGLLLRSEDGGKSFSSLASPYKGTWFGVTAMHDGGLLIYGLRGNAFLSHDRGKTWKQAETGTPVSISSAIEYDAKHLVLTNQAGQVLVSADGGAHFAPLPKIPLPIAAVAPADDGTVALATLRGVMKMPLAVASIAKQ